MQKEIIINRSNENIMAAMIEEEEHTIKATINRDEKCKLTKKNIVPHDLYIIINKTK